MADDSRAATSALLASLRFDKDGLIPAIAQQFDSGEVLMLAWMNRAALEASLRAGQVHYWSRSRGTLWRKGEQSGQEQRLVELRVDCDRDCLLLQVDQTGVACHTGRRTCFFTALRGGKLEEIARVEIDPAKLYGEEGETP
jgi:phosphoribosyl-AMP cyclohydrolase